ncbi:Drosophila melanogaster CG15040 gene product, putative [Babesia ovata]|uniref:Drosophila melanogaster CG15040 gene product, putative n=1 Tax=Babesia ovata TaxID=189622 RepID=A0A2H6KAS9_9APIC|nr:Drosophila melanogaster CG15040 gene product, putative [Babesia ovata]GBE60104.1 Drosophila melanogaster CG15040 gene product, putative [Babesia ovata]
MERSSKHVYSTNKRAYKLEGETESSYVSKQGDRLLRMHVCDPTYEGCKMVANTRVIYQQAINNAVSSYSKKYMDAHTATHQFMNAPEPGFELSFPHIECFGARDPAMPTTPSHYPGKPQGGVYTPMEYRTPSHHDDPRFTYGNLQNSRQHTEITATSSAPASPGHALSRRTYEKASISGTALVPITNSSAALARRPSIVTEVCREIKISLQRERRNSTFDNCIPTENHMQAPLRQLTAAKQPIEDYVEAKPVEVEVVDEEPDYPHLALDLSMLTQTNQKKEQQPKPKPVERRPAAQQKEPQTEVKLIMGKPRHPYAVQFNDPVEKELGRWHNSHMSTIKWTRIKRGVYTADDQEVTLVKLNGGLYVKGTNNKKKQEHIPIDKFAQRLQKAGNA